MELELESAISSELVSYLASEKGYDSFGTE